ncbi:MULTISPECIES: LLM class flavin-dependent oxidoreductase [Blastococcus]|uniref:Putative monooxygenase n=1 Tax=Blastococcus saxobsidens (strain DD2) TaxID=1146883 RepID=H6RJN9_BLASD|nr:MULTISPECIES: LLM class flavin-dependent oxidoreductase [Blastococcus]TFV93005.1 LLM class flavin-dependent oxidoreductase [Blastococcus sp. CT_GayMR20]CCG02344.1 Putative monooxygenase [Blastococcus saxobsidens DD2]
MRLGMFIQPGHFPEYSYKAGYDYDLEQIKLLDELGYDEVWLGEHFTSRYENNPAPDLLIAQAIRETTNIKLAVGAHALPYHHPMELACRVAALDHLSEGRILMGAGSGAIPSDWNAFCVDGMSGQHREMARESLEIIQRLWTDKTPWKYEGKFWTVERIADDWGAEGGLGWHMYPYQEPHPPIAFAGFSERSGSLKIAGMKGYIPMSLSMNERYMASHWEAVEEGAEIGGRVADRKDWRVVKEVFVADTDAEARKYAVDGALGRYYSEYMLPLYRQFGFLGHLKHDDSVDDADVDVEYLYEHQWAIGSVDTVTEKLTSLHDACGGFETLLILGLHYAADPEPWNNSLRLLKQKVAPQIS